MHFSELRNTDLFGRFYLKTANSKKYLGYYEAVDAIRSLVYSEQWLQCVTGYYINVADENQDAVRLSYFTPSPKMVDEVVKRFVASHGLQMVRRPVPARAVVVSKAYGGEELRFRKYLATYSPIGLDIMAADLLNARCLFATFRWQVMRARKPYKPHFLRTFKNQSMFYNSLAPAEKEQFWLDLANWPNPPQVDWAHMFVNMVLAADWNTREEWPKFFQPQPPLTTAEINKKVKEQGFQIPPGWHP
ncbi:MAG: hypothetical protein JRJ12_15180 [Deltaproteobacteria bacterium]|nr:hypothetical protein [Deltaproteobacteria bacterium]MBW2072661.1 hypothetical protein [Deltaproteobacteria bacterium]